MVRHLAIFKGDGAEKILSGEKKIESRFASRRIPPFGAISAGDLVYIKPSGGDIIGQFRVKRVIFLDNGPSSPRYTTIIFIGESTKFITSPIKLKKKDLRGWVVIQ